MTANRRIFLNIIATYMRRRSFASEGRCRRHGEAARKGPRGGRPPERGRVQVRRFSGAKLTWLTRRPVPDARRIPPPDVNLRRGATGVRHGPSRTHGQFPRKTTRIGWHAATLFRPVFPSQTLPHYQKLNFENITSLLCGYFSKIRQSEQAAGQKFSVRPATEILST